MRKRIIAFFIAVSLVVTGISIYNYAPIKAVKADEKSVYKILEITDKADDKKSDFGYLLEQNILDVKTVEYLSKQYVEGSKEEQNEARKELLPLVQLSVIDYVYEYEKYSYDFLDTDADDFVDGYVEETKQTVKGAYPCTYDEDSKTYVYDENGTMFFYPYKDGIVKGLSKEVKKIDEPVYTKFVARYLKIKSGEINGNIGQMKVSLKKDEDFKTNFKYAYLEDKKLLDDASVIVKAADEVTPTDLDGKDIVYLNVDKGLSDEVANAIFNNVADQNIVCVLNKDTSLTDSTEKLNATQKLKLALTIGYPNAVKQLIYVANCKDDGVESDAAQIIKDNKFLNCFETYATNDNTKGLVDYYLPYVKNQTNAEKRQKEVKNFGIDNESLSLDVAEHNVLAIDNILTSENVVLSDATSDIEDKNAEIGVNIALSYLLSKQKVTYTLDGQNIRVLEVEPCNSFMSDKEWRLRMAGKLPYYYGNVYVDKMQSKEYSASKKDINEEYNFVYIGSKYDTMAHEEVTSEETKWISFDRNKTENVTYTLNKIGCNEKKESFVPYFSVDNTKHSEGGENTDTDFKNYTTDKIQIRTDINGKMYYKPNQLSYIGNAPNNYQISGLETIWYDSDGFAHDTTKEKLDFMTSYCTITCNDNTFEIAIYKAGYFVIDNLTLYINRKPYTLRAIVTYDDSNIGIGSSAFPVHGGIYNIKANDKFELAFDATNFNWDNGWHIAVDNDREQSFEYSLKYHDYNGKNADNSYIGLSKKEDLSKYSDKSKYICDYKTGDTGYYKGSKLYLKANACTNENELRVTDIAITRKHYIASSYDTDNSTHDFNEYDNLNQDNNKPITNSYDVSNIIYTCEFDKESNLKNGTYTVKELKDMGVSVEWDNGKYKKLVRNDYTLVGHTYKCMKESTRLFRIYMLPVIDAEKNTIPTVYNDETMNGTLYNHIGDKITLTDGTTTRFSGNDISKKNYNDLKAFSGIVLFSNDFYNEDGTLKEETFDKSSYVYHVAKFKDAYNINTVDAKTIDAKLQKKTHIYGMITQTPDDNVDFTFTVLNNTKKKNLSCELYVDVNKDGIYSDNEEITDFSLFDDRTDNEVAKTSLQSNHTYLLSTDFDEEYIKKLHGSISFKIKVDDASYFDRVECETVKKTQVRVLSTIGDLEDTLSTELKAENVSDLFDFQFTAYTPTNEKYTNDTVITTENTNSVKVSDYNILVTTYDNDANTAKLVKLFNDSGKMVIFVKDVKAENTNIQSVFRTTLNYIRFGKDIYYDYINSISENYPDGFTKDAGKKTFLQKPNDYSEMYLLYNADKNKNKYFIYNGRTKDTVIDVNTDLAKKVNNGQILSYPYNLFVVDDSKDSDKMKVKSGTQSYQLNPTEKTTVYLTLDSPKDSDIYRINSGDTYNNAYCFTTEKGIYLGMLNDKKWNADEKKLFVNALVTAYREEAVLPDISLLNSYKEELEADGAVAYIDYSVQDERDENCNPLTEIVPLEIYTVGNYKLLALTFHVDLKDDLHDTSVALSTYRYVSDNNAEDKLLEENVLDYTQTIDLLNGKSVGDCNPKFSVKVDKLDSKEVTFFIMVTDKDVLDTPLYCNLHAKTGDKEKDYEVKLVRRELLDLK